MRTAFGSAAGIDMVRRYPVGVDLNLQRHSVWRTIVIALLGFVALAAWGLSSPAGSSPDDDFHLTSIWCGQGERVGLCENVTDDSVDVPDRVLHAPCFAFNKDATGACQQNLSDSMVSMSHANQIEHAYPGGFYWVMSWFVSSNVTLSVMLMRMLNSAIFILTATATFLLVDRGWKSPLGIGIAATIVPLGLFIIPSTNPSSWTIYAPAFIFLLTRTLLRTKNRQRATLLVAVTAFIAVLSSAARSDAAAFTVLAVGLAALAEWGSWFKRTAFYLLSILVGAFALGSLIIGHQSGAVTAGLSDDTTSASPGSLALLVRNIVDLPGLFAGALGTSGLGWLDTPMPSSVWVIMTGLFAAALLNSVILKSRFRELAVPMVATTALWCVPLIILQSSGTVVGALVQPRYVLPLLALTLISFLTTSTSAFAVNRLQILLTYLLSATAACIALAANTLRYSAGLSTAGLQSGLGASLPLIVGILATATVAHFSYRQTRERNLTPTKNM